MCCTAGFDARMGLFCFSTKYSVTTEVPLNYSSVEVLIVKTKGTNYEYNYKTCQ